MSDVIYKSLVKDFPKEAMTIDSSRGFALTSIKAQYIKERLNEVFGIYGWEFREEFKEVSGAVLCHGTLVIIKDTDNVEKSVKRFVFATGGSAVKRNVADSYKGAATDALSKAASYIGIGNEVFKGNVNLSTVSDKKPAPKPVVKKKELPKGDFKKALEAIENTKDEKAMAAFKKKLLLREWTGTEFKSILRAISKKGESQKPSPVSPKEVKT